MKPDKHHDPVKSNGLPLEPYYFEFMHPTARAVRIAGTFNDWQPEAAPMHPIGEGYWLKETTLAPGTYEYKFVVDGEWRTDPSAAEQRPNQFGSMNSVVRV